MYQLYSIDEAAFNPKKLMTEFKDYDKATERIGKELAKNKDFKYILEETTGHVNSYGDLLATVVEEN